jgi:hypothetical protein
LCLEERFANRGSEFGRAANRIGDVPFPRAPTSSSLQSPFVWDRVHGFRDMPAWKNISTPQQVIAIVTSVMSDAFAP